MPFDTTTIQPSGPTITDETVSLVRQAMADTTRAITTASGLLGYELETPAKVVVPVTTPLVNMLPRRRGAGVDIVHWKAITSFDTARNWGTLSDGGTPSAVTYAVAALQNAIQSIALMNTVTFQAQWRGRSLEADVRARCVAELLYQLKIVEERWVLGASAYLMLLPAPVLATATSGGTVAAATYWVKVTAKNAQGETTDSSATKIVTTGSTSTVTITIFTVPNATQYNVYIGSDRALNGRWHTPSNGLPCGFLPSRLVRLGDGKDANYCDTHRDHCVTRGALSDAFNMDGTVPHGPTSRQGRRPPRRKSRRMNRENGDSRRRRSASEGGVNVAVWVRLLVVALSTFVGLAMSGSGLAHAVPSDYIVRMLISVSVAVSMRLVRSQSTGKRDRARSCVRRKIRPTGLLLAAKLKLTVGQLSEGNGDSQR